MDEQIEEGGKEKEERKIRKGRVISLEREAVEEAKSEGENSGSLYSPRTSRKFEQARDVGMLLIEENKKLKSQLLEKTSTLQELYKTLESTQFTNNQLGTVKHLLTFPFSTF